MIKIPGGNLAACYFLLSAVLLTHCGVGVNGSANGLSAPSTSTESATASFIAFGDWGAGTTAQKAVATSVANYCESNACEFVVTTGDNFYPTGVASVTDPHWEQEYRDVYGALGIPFYASLGNHDVYGSVQAQIDYSKKNPSWNMPAENYSFVRPADSGSPLVEFFVVNNYTFTDKADSWLSQALEKSRARWKLLVMHYPFLSNAGRQGEDARHDPRLLQTTCNKVDLVLAGHDHLFAHFRGARGGCRIEQLTIGTGGAAMGQAVLDDPRVLYTVSVHGFGWLQITYDQLAFRFIGTGGNILYSATLMK